MTPEWPRVRAGHLFEEVDERAGGDSDLPLLSVSIHHGVVPQEAVTDRLPRAEEFAHYKICAAGDLVINRMRAFQGAVGMSGFRGLVSPDYSVLRVRPPNNARFLHHLFRSNWFIGEMTARLRGIGTSEQGNVRTPRINVEDLRDIPIPVPRPEVQQRLAAFLDGETARIGALIEKKQRMGDLLEQALEGRIAALIESVIQGHPVLPQRRLTVIGFSNVDKKSEEGQEVVKLCNYTDVYYQEEIRGELDFVVATASAEQIRRFTLQAGLTAS